jgi:hypothetical protein
VRGSGHDAIDNDVSGCINQALRRFIAGRPVGTPCASTDNAVRPLPLPPTSLRDFQSAPGVGGTRGRAVFAVLDTLQDARLTSLQTLLAGLSSRGGGLHGGRFSGPSDVDGRIRLSRYSYLRGLRVTGRVTEDGADLTGRVSVQGPRGTSGSLTITADGVTGRLGGRAVRYRGSIGAGAAAAGAHAHRADGSVMGIDARLARATLRRAALRRP